MMISSIKKPDHPLRIAVTLSLLVFLGLTVVFPSPPSGRWPLTPTTPGMISADVSLASPFMLEREKPTGEKFLKTSVVPLHPCVFSVPGFSVAADIAAATEHLRITSLFVYTQTTSSRL
jgi:hypothetical protein